MKKNTPSKTTHWTRRLRLQAVQSARSGTEASEQQLFSEIWRNPKAWSTENQKESKKTNRSKHYTE